MKKWDKQHLINLGLTERRINAIYAAALKEAAAIGVSVHDFNPDKPFSFADYPKTKAAIDRVIGKLQSDTQTVIVNGIRSGWTLANNKNNALCDFVFGDNKNNLTRAQERSYYNNNDTALEAFLQRKTAGLKLSDRVWNYTNQFKTEIEMGLDLGIRDGVSAAEMSRELQQYLNNPNMLFRRVRDEHGQLRLSQAAQSYHPGTGVYRSSHKNAMRLARTENNMAYHTADYLRWQQLDFVVGIEVRLSNNHTLNGKEFTDMCDLLAGKYPKDFKFVGWHPQCRCYAISILKTTEEMQSEMEGSVNEVKDVPENFKSWIKDNAERIEGARERGTLPYFIKDNTKYTRTPTQIYNDYGREWLKAFFDDESGGFNVYHKDHQFSKIGGKYEKEVGILLAKQGKQVEFLSEQEDRKQGVKHPDIYFDNQTWDIKSVISYTSGSIMDSIWDGKKANNVIFYFTDKIDIGIIKDGYNRVYGRFLKLEKLNIMPGIYYIDEDGRLIKYR